MSEDSGCQSWGWGGGSANMVVWAYDGVALCRDLRSSYRDSGFGCCVVSLVSGALRWWLEDGCCCWTSD
jgi:hypothetical protein